MRKLKITLLILACMSGLSRLSAQKVLNDWNGYVASKNTGGTGYINLVAGYEEKAAQTYHYSGPGRVSAVMIKGDNPGLIFNVPLRVSVFSVDSKGRPVSELAGADIDFRIFDTSRTVNFSGGVNVSSSFAVVVAIRSTAFFGQTFQVRYTGNGEGKGQDLASLAGSSTGGNWTSAMSTFNKDGDFYLIPQMAHDISADFSASTYCATTSTSISFTNGSAFTRDSMFNRIYLAGYSGGVKAYAWDFGDGTTSNALHPTKTYSAAGSYSVRLITSVVGWSATKTDTQTMKISVGLAAGYSNLVNLTCNSSADGRFTASATGGTSPYKYSVDGKNYQTATAFTGLSAGSYTLYVMDNLGCRATTTLSITEPRALAFTTLSTSSATCNNSDGAILAVGTGGTGALQYKLNSGTAQSSGSFTGLAWGAYAVTVVDANTCSYTEKVVVGNTNSPTLNVSYNNVSCFGGNDGSITLSSSGGTGAVQYSINGGTSFQSSGSFPNLTAGTYSVLVKDAAGCGRGEIVTITQPSKIDFSLSATSATCFGKSDGEISVNGAIGGLGKLSYSINGTNYQSSGVFRGLAAGNYTVYVRDVASCQVTKTISVGQPTDITSVKTVTNVRCNGEATGSILVTASGGTPDYWFSLNGRDFQATGAFPGVAAGSYSIIVKDKNSCFDTVSATVTQPSAITAVITSTNSTCGNSNGSMLVTGSGGTGRTYTYSMDGSNWVTSGLFSGKKSGTYVVAIKDSVGCIETVVGDIMDANGPVFGTISSTNVTCNGGSDGSITVNSVSGGTGTIEYSVDGVNWQTSNVLRNLKAGNYNVLIRDANGCRSESSAISITQPGAITILKNVTNVNCFGTNNGSVTITASGGSGTLAYSIDGGRNWQSDRTFSNLYAGEYTVTVRDAGGCTNSLAFSISQPAPINTLLGILNISCHDAKDGELTITASGGKFPYTYSIGNGYQSSNTFTGLSGGNYTYSVKDANGCIYSSNVFIYEPDELGINSISANVSCAGGNNGVINLTVSGGLPPYRYLWSNRAETEDIFNLAAGSYSVTVTDANGCTKNASFTLTQPSQPLVINGVVNNGSGSNGDIDITVTGGVPPYTFRWSNGKITEDVNSLSPGNYTVTVTDNNGCVATSTFTVAGAAGLSAQELDREIRLYPNPTSDKVTVSVNGHRIQFVGIVDGAGRTVYQSRINATSYEINTSALAPGIYQVQIQAEGTTAVKKLIISR